MATSTATGNVFVISAPSGAGKSSLVNALCKKDPQIKVSVSHTTRNKRLGDEEGIHYHFVDTAEFKHMIANNDFLEYATVYDNYYGTHKTTITQLQNMGYDIILEIDRQGALQIRKLLKQAILIYVLPPSIAELRKRLQQRNTDSIETIEKRQGTAIDDISYAKYFDFAIINDDFNAALDELYSIIVVHRLKAQHVLEKWYGKHGNRM